MQALKSTESSSTTDHQRENSQSHKKGRDARRVKGLYLSSSQGTKLKAVFRGKNRIGANGVSRNVVEVPKELSKPSLTEATGLAYIPLYSPARVSSHPEVDRDWEFTVEELEKFECRYENGYDIQTDQLQSMAADVPSR